MAVEKFRRPLAPALGWFIRKVRLTSTQVLALNTPISILPAPKSGWANVLQDIMIQKDAGTAYTIGTAAGLSVKYTDGSGLEVSQCALTGFIDQTTSQTRFMKAHTAASGANTTAVVANAALVLQMLTANVTGGTGGLKLLIRYSVLPMVP